MVPWLPVALTTQNALTTASHAVEPGGARLPPLASGATGTSFLLPGEWLLVREAGPRPEPMPAGVLPSPTPAATESNGSNAT